MQYSSIQGKFGEIISTQDIATYTALCALAEFDRSEIKSRLIDNSDLRNFLETVPEMKDIIHDFYNSRYGSCLTLLDRVKNDFALGFAPARARELALYQDSQQGDCAIFLPVRGRWILM